MVRPAILDLWGDNPSGRCRNPVQGSASLGQFLQPRVMAHHRRMDASCSPLRSLHFPWVASCCASRRSILRSILGVTCVIVGATTCIYTGVLLMASSAIVSWSTALVPALFALSSFNSGTAFVSCIYRLREKAKRARRMTVWNGFAVLLTTAESVVVGLYLGWLAASSPTTLPAAQLLIDGSLSLPFWLFVVGSGLVIPWAIALIGLLRHKDPKWLVVFSGICALTGACALRFLVLAIGLRFPVGLI